MAPSKAAFLLADNKLQVSDLDDMNGSTAQESISEEKAPKEKETETTEHETNYLEGIKLFIVMSGLTVLMFLVMLDISILGTAIPQITSDFKRLQDVGWYVSAYQLASATWTLLAFFLLFEIGSAICGAATSSTMLIIGRAIAGLGCSGLTNGLLTVIVGAIAPRKRPLYTAVAMGIGQIGIVLGPVIGGLFTEHASWRWCFYVNLPLGGLVGLFIAVIAIPDQIEKERVSFGLIRKIMPKFDLTGFALFTPASIMLLLALQFGSGEYGWNSPTVIGLFCGAGAVALLFIAWEWRVGDEAMIPLKLVSQTVVWTSSLNFAFLMSVTVGASNFLPIYFQSVKGLSPTMSAVYMLAGIISQLILLLFSGALMTKLGYYIPWALFAAGGTAIGCGLISTWAPGTTLAHLIGFQILYGFRGAGIQIGTVALQNALPPAQVAVGSSFLVFCQNMCSAIAITIANTIFQESLKSKIPIAAPSVGVQAVIAAGGSAEAVQKLAPAGSATMDGILRSYSESFGNVFYLWVGFSVAAFAVSFGMGWFDLRKLEKKKPVKPEEV
ncbi:unnamed protein product [Clonostachys chloroleuca]|uniref:Major facilitator superfamily (MFS) profile domain-containing protein n=1 Tax=Clonostachys chloroleuca TaxID=1926264 RepID=A0AA35LX76_9HYPO|nr:unnamed protein product [Clonostachys chloroleuca]